MKIGSEKLPENEKIAGIGEKNPTDSENSTLSRRKFTRNALLGSAVLLTLGSRSALGKALPPVCVSKNLLVSYDYGANSGFTQEQLDEVNNFLDTTNKIPNSDYETDTQKCYEVHP